MPEVEIIGAFYQRIMVASEPAWYPLKTQEMPQKLCMYVRKQKIVWAAVIGGRIVLYSET